AADGNSEDVAVQLGWLIGFTGLQLRLLDEIVVGADKRIPIVFVDGAVEGIGSALGDQGDLCPSGTALVGAIVGGGDAKFLHGIEGDRHNRGEGVATLVVD